MFMFSINIRWGLYIALALEKMTQVIHAEYSHASESPEGKHSATDEKTPTAASQHYSNTVLEKASN